MRLYRMELFKVLSRKFTWIMSGLWIISLFYMLLMENHAAGITVVELGQTAGYKRFVDLMQFFILYTEVWLIAILSPLYCEDKQKKTDVLILTSVKGKLSDFVARLGVAFTLAIGAFLFAVLLDYGTCHILYGYSDGGFILKNTYFIPEEYASIFADTDIFSYIINYLLHAMSALFMLAGIMVWISTKCNTTTNSLVAVLMVFWCPIVFDGFFRYGSIGYFLQTGQPITLIMAKYRVLNWSMYGWHFLLAYFIAIVGIICGGKRWCHIK